MSERCADCGKLIGMLEASYYVKGPAEDIGNTYHAACVSRGAGSEIKKLREALAAQSALLSEAKTALEEAQAVIDADDCVETYHRISAVLAKLKAVQGATDPA